MGFFGGDVGRHFPLIFKVTEEELRLGFVEEEMTGTLSLGSEVCARIRCLCARGVGEVSGDCGGIEASGAVVVFAGIRGQIIFRPCCKLRDHTVARVRILRSGGSC